MPDKFENGLFIFRRDLRIVDNNGLNLLNEVCKNIFTIFIFTPEQATSENKFKSDNALQFMIESLEDLSLQISKNGGKLYTFYGHNEKVIAECIKSLDISIVCFNLDYTPYAMKRDTSIQTMCNKMNVYLLTDHDYYLNSPGSILNGSGNSYQKFTPYYETALKQRVEAPSNARHINFTKKQQMRVANLITLQNAMTKFTKVNPDILVHGGRQHAMQALAEALKTQKHYATTHNELWMPTSQLSAYIKFGCISIREVYKAFRRNYHFIRQLYWRDFYANILFSFPYVLGHAMKPKYDKIKWHHNASWFKAWCDGQTGYPVVDAGMRQLKQTGYLHNRSRLIVASLLVKTLLISWEHGEKYFAKMLTDYDPASNNGNWQWIASTGADSQPFFRIFNPTEQGKNFDPDCKYIKTWVPELRNVDPRIIHNWDTEWDEPSNKSIQYVKPICDYKVQKELVLKMYGKIF